MSGMQWETPGEHLISDHVEWSLMGSPPDAEHTQPQEGWGRERAQMCRNESSGWIRRRRAANSMHVAHLQRAQIKTICWSALMGTQGGWLVHMPGQGGWVGGVEWERPFGTESRGGSWRREWVCLACSTLNTFAQSSGHRGKVRRLYLQSLCVSIVSSSPWMHSTARWMETPSRWAVGPLSNPVTPTLTATLILTVTLTLTVTLSPHACKSCFQDAHGGWK